MEARRNILLLAAAALAALLAGSCVKTLGPEDDGWTPLGGDRPVSFSSNLSAPATKAGLPAGTTFGVFAYSQPPVNGSTGGWNGTQTPNFMFNEDVLFDGTNYSYSPIKYWPNDTNHTITFWAYCPYSANPDLLKTGSSTVPFTNTTNNFPDVRFTADGTTDLLISNKIKSKSKPSLGTPVTFTFSHVLSDINVSAKKVDATPQYTVMLKSLSFENIRMNAIFRNSNASWNTYSDTPGNHICFQDDPDIDTDNIEISTSFEPVGHAILLPQVFESDDAVLRVVYSIKSSSMTHERPVVCEIPLKKMFVGSSSTWSKNTRYTIKITITPDDPIDFTVSWSNWGDVYNWHITS